MDQDTDKQKDNSAKPWLWKKGQSGNLAGRPKGKTMKDYTREFLSKMTDEERDEFLEGIPKEVIWKMSEGNPKESIDAQIDTKLGEDLTDEEIELAKKIIDERRSKTNGSESQGSVS